MTNGYKSYLAIQTLSGVFADVSPSSDATECLLYDSFGADVTFEEMLCQPVRNSRIIMDKKYGTESVSLNVEGPVNVKQTAWIYVLKNMFNDGYAKAVVDGETAVWDYDFYPADFSDSNYLSLESYRGGKLHKYYPAKFNTLSFNSAVNQFLNFSATALAGQSAAPATTSATPSFESVCGLKFDNCTVTIGGASYDVTEFNVDVDLNEEMAYVLGSTTGEKIRPAGQISPVGLTVSLLDYDNTLHTNYLANSDSSFEAVITGSEISGASGTIYYTITISMPYIVWDDSKFDVGDTGPIAHDLTFKGLYNSDGANDKAKAPISITVRTDVDYS